VSTSQNRRTFGLSNEAAQRLIDLIRSKNPYQLSRREFCPSGLRDSSAGLTEHSRPCVSGWSPRCAALCPSDQVALRKLGADVSEALGYDLFEPAHLDVCSVTNVPVPANYVVGPGDQLEVQLYGQQEFQYCIWP